MFIFPSEPPTAISLTTTIHRSLVCPVTMSLAWMSHSSGLRYDFIFSPLNVRLHAPRHSFFFLSFFPLNLQLPYPSLRMFIAHLDVRLLRLWLGLCILFFPLNVRLHAPRRSVFFIFLSEPATAISVTTDVHRSLGCPMTISLARISTFNRSLAVNAQLLQIFLLRGFCQRRRRQGERTEEDGEKTVLDGEDDTVAELMPARRVMSEVGAALTAPHPANRDRLPASNVTAPLDLCRLFRSFCTLPHR